VKTLPDNPSLDHLRAQAKDLLAGLRDAAPETTLAQAQASLARLYGFPTWTALKAEVDRRRDSAEVADPGLARRLADRFGLGAPTGPMCSMARPDDSGRAWSLETDRGRWLVRTFDTAIWIVPPETDVTLQAAASGAGVRLPAPVRSQAGQIVEELDGHRWRAYEWANAGPPLSPPVSADVARQVGETLAAVHGLGLAVDRLCPWHSTRVSAESWRDTAARVTARGASWADAMAEVVPRLEDLEQIGEGITPPAPVLTHNNLGPATVRIGPDGRIVVLEWWHAGGQPPAWELAEALIHWVIGNDRGTRAMVAGYRATAGSVPTLELASFRGALVSLANYIHGQVGQALEATGAEDRRHAERNVRHLLSSPPTRAHLEHLLEVAASA
jgi:hypothetical protein